MNNPALTLLDALLDRQKQAWLAGSRLSIETLLLHSPFENDSGALLDLIYNEIVLREELGEQPSLEEYAGRYPQLDEDLKLHFDIHRAINDNLLTDTRWLQDSAAEMGLLPPNNNGDLADYEVLGELGRGGMGIVYKARHVRLKRVVALKMIQQGHAPSPRELARFRTEAETIARLQHPNIVQIFEIGQTRGLPFLALELAEHGTLAQHLQEVIFSPQSAAELLEILARTIHYAHLQHIVHRDLKPANVLFGNDSVPKIADFGLAKILEDDTDAPRDPTRTGEPIGTPRYMAPEQATGQTEQIGPATDVHALGALLYECLTGQAPFLAASVMETMERIRHDDPLPPRRLQPSIPKDLETICLTCLRKQIEKRYSSALDLAEDLRRFLEGKPIQARPTPSLERGWKWCRRHPAAAILTAVTLALILGVGSIICVQQYREQQRLTELREEVTQLLQTGQAAMERQDWATAQARFETAWSKTESEPALEDLQSNVTSWVKHSQQQANQEHRRQRHRQFVELRDEAVFQGAILAAMNPLQKEPLQAALKAIQAAGALLDSTDASFNDDQQQLQLLEAELVLAEGFVARALDLLYRKRLAERPTRRFHVLRAACLQRLGRAAEADRERRNADALPPTDTLDYFWTGAERFRRQDLTGAIRAFEQTLALQADHFPARCFLSVCFLNDKRPAEAKVGLTACIGQRPAFVWNYLFRGLASLQLGDTAGAAGDFQRAARRNPSEQARFALHSNLGLLRLKEKRWPEAHAELEEATRLMPNEYSAWVNLAQVYWQQRQWDAAEKSLGQAIALQPQAAFLYRTRANLFRDQNKWPEALADIDQALRHDSPNSSTHASDLIERAKIFYRLNRLDDALRAVQEVPKLQSKSIEAWQVRAEILLRQNRFSEAAVAFDRCLSLGAASSDLYRGRGFAHMKLGQFQQAVDDYSRALGLQSDSDILQHRGWAYFFADAYRLALRDFDDALRLQPGVHEALIGRGLALVYLGDHRRAIADADLASKLDSPEMYVNRACIYAQAIFHLRIDKKLSSRQELVRRYQEKSLDALRQALEMLPWKQREPFFRSKIDTDPGLEPLRELPDFKKRLEKVLSGGKNALQIPRSDYKLFISLSPPASSFSPLY